VRVDSGPSPSGPGYGAAVVISVDEFELFCGRTIDGMVACIDSLTAEQLNQAPPWAGASTPFQLMTHALGACTWWVDHMVCHRPSSRDRNAEFAATGTAADLHAQAADVRAMVAANRAAMTTATGLVEPARTQTELAGEWTVGAALMHAYEELAQHLGHLEMTADVLTGAGEASAGS